MKTWHPESWSKQARKMADNQFKYLDIVKIPKVKCRNCGHIHVGKFAPKLCPVCAHPQSYFELREKNY